MTHFIKEILIQNFQSHFHTVVKPAPNGQLTVVVGPSDSGKSAILRALKWVLYNTPQGADFIRVGAAFAKVTITFADGQTVVRWRSQGGINRYLVNGQALEGFGTGVPLEVQQVTGVKVLTIGDLTLNLNMAEQLHGPFLGSSVTGGARAKVLGKLAGTEEIDFASKQLGTDLFRRKQDERRLQGELDELKVKIAGYDYLPAMQNQIRQLEEVAAKVKDTEDLKRQLADFRRELMIANGAIETYQEAINKWKEIEYLEWLVGDIKNTLESKDWFEQLKSKHQQATFGMVNNGLIIDRLKSLEKVQDLVSSVDVKVMDHKTFVDGSILHEKYSQQIEAAKRMITKHAGAEEADRLTTNLGDTAFKLNALRNYRSKLRWLLSTLDDLKEKLDGLQSIEVAEKILVDTEQLDTKAKDINMHGKTYKYLLGKTNGLNDHVGFLKGELDMIEGLYKDELITAGKCPLCGNENIDPNLLKEAM